MQAPIKPPDEASRQAALCELLLLDTPSEERFDRVTRAAKRMFGVQTAMVTLLDNERLWFKSRIGFEPAETARRISFCGHAILQDDVFVIEDTLLDPRFSDNPLVTAAPAIRFYAGIPLRGPNGYKIGTLCLLDPRPRVFDADERASLRDLGSWAESEVNTVSLSSATGLARADAAETHRQLMLLQAVMEGAEALIFVRDLEGRFLYANAPYASMVHCEGQDLTGLHLSDIYSAQVALDYLQRDRDVAASGQVRRDETRSSADDVDRPHSIIRSPLRNARGEIYGICGVGTDLTQARLAEQALRELNDQLQATTVFQQAILNSANFSIISTDVDGVIQLFNVGAERMLGHSAAEVIGRESMEILHHAAEVRARAAALTVELGVEIGPGFEALVAKARHSTADEHEWTYVRKDGTRFPVMLSVTALRDDQNVITGFLGIAYDLIERKQVESMKSEFISTVSHELRTPLTSIRGSLGLLSAGVSGEIPERARSLLDIARNNCERLVRLINEILDVEKIESGNMFFDMRPQKLLPLVEQAIASTQDYAAQLKVTLALVPGAADALVTIDTDRITQVVVNLLSNAAKFSNADSIVEVRLVAMAGGIRLSVRDFGSGIPAAFRSRIFQKFAQADSSDTRRKGGTGLGLNISKVLVEKHHGRIDFTSIEGQGSEFYFDLPVTPAPSKLNLAPGRVLICDDNPVVASTLADVLEQSGMLSDIAGSAAEARALLQVNAYEAMTLDLILPDEDGISLLRWIRAQDRIRSLPVVILSAMAEEPHKAETCGAVGVVAWLEKPVDYTRLLAALQLGAHPDAGENQSVLYVEDDLDLANVISAMLAPTMSVTHVTTLAAAHRALSRFRYSLILLDLQLPDGNGADLLAQLPEINASTPVVIFSAAESTRFSIENVHASLVKSRTSNEDLLAILQSLISRESARKSGKNLALELP